MKCEIVPLDNEHESNMQKNKISHYFLQQNKSFIPTIIQKGQRYRRLTPHWKGSWHNRSGLELVLQYLFKKS